MCCAGLSRLFFECRWRDRGLIGNFIGDAAESESVAPSCADSEIAGPVGKGRSKFVGFVKLINAPGVEGKDKDFSVVLFGTAGEFVTWHDGTVKRLLAGGRLGLGP
jgi:hypothetical protein